MRRAGASQVQFALEGIVGARLMEGEEQLGDLAVADVVAGAAGAVAEGLGKPALAHPDGPAEDHVLLGAEPVQGEELAYAGAVIADWGVPHELLVGHDLLEARRLEAAGFEELVPYEQLVWDTPVSYDRARVRELSALHWLGAQENVIFCGPVGVGKSWFAQALGHSACRGGHHVRYVKVAKLLLALHQLRADNSLVVTTARGVS